MKSKLDQALFYQKQGLSVIPVRPDKKPIIKWTQYQTEKAGPDLINDWWSKWPDANVGLVTGAISNLMVVDVDSLAGHDALDEFLPENIQTPVARTTSGGWHYYFRYKKGLVNRARVITDCDVRTDGGYVVAPASVGENGKAYSWAPGLGLHEVPPAAMPELLFSVLQAGNAQASPSEHKKDRRPSITNAFTRGTHNTETEQSITNHNNHNISFEKGGRDETLFHIANCLVKGGMPSGNLQKCLHFIGLNCNPPFPEKEINSKIQSALKRLESTKRNLTGEVREWLNLTWDNITITDALQGITNLTNADRPKITVIFHRLVKEGLIERVPGRTGIYRKVDATCDAMDFLNAEIESTDIWLPFNLHRMVETMPGNIILMAGEPNAGKTGLLLNIIRNNMHKAEIHYFNSEMGGSELKKRLSLFSDILPSQWQFKAWERSDNFSDVIKPGKGKINIIDFLEIHDNFYEIGGRLAEIHKKLKGAVAIVALQKNAGTDTGLGGFRGLEKPRLYLAMSPGKLKIVKAKNWKTDRNPNGLQYSFKVAQGCRFTTVRDWHRPEK